jgi:hypothetical protein
MNIEELTIKEAREIANLFASLPTRPSQPDSVWEIGEKYFFRTVTLYYTGVLESVTDNELVLKQAAWIADTGRFNEAMETGEFNEVEVYPQDTSVILNRSSMIDACRISSIPTKQK